MAPTRRRVQRRRAQIWVLLGPDLGFGPGGCGPERRPLLLEPGGSVVPAAVRVWLEVELGACPSWPCRELEHHGEATMRECRGSSGVNNKISGPNPAGSVCGVRYRTKVYPALPVPAATAPVGVVSLLGGAAEVCRHFPAPTWVWCCLRAKA
ncbi:hypothetical protein QYE76_059887 [Lolium multiflorum]|uniref:Uncharacterized protein n=1 Tax=Lolium multiflorum TaxID=4521 RepID=A0AAD8RY21_LOLMU|nr:hypothetical protein QYE76_059887 [Lolium multiflorum]